MQLITAAAGYTANIFFGTTSDDNSGRISYAINDEAMAFWTNDALRMTISNAGEVTKPLQPAFLAINGTQDTNVTGNGTVHTCVMDSEIYDQGGDYNLTTFTAPVTGKYLLQMNVQVGGMTTAADVVQHRIVTTLRTYTNYYSRANSLPDEFSQNTTVVADMDAGDECTFAVVVSGESGDVCDINALGRTWVSGCLLA